MVNKITILVFAFAFCYQSGFAQLNKSIGDIQFESGNYHEALQEYLKESNGKDYSLNTTIQIARCFDAIGIPTKAHKWYEIAINQDPTNFNYAIEVGKNQMKVGKYVEAKISFLNYAQIDKQLSNHYVSVIDNIANIINNEGTQLESFAVVNSASNDFASFFYNGQLYYNTDIKNINLDSDAKKTILKTESSVTCDLNNNALTKGIFTKSNIAPITISKNNTVAYSSNNAKNQLFLARRMNNTLYVGMFDKHKIINAKPFPFNKLNTSITDPYLNDNGTVLYFSSDMIGGYGGYDLYYSQLENGSWTKPVNLGEDINTVGNEISPNVDLKNNLYFASDYHPGIGGYDIFKAQWVFGGWMNVVNMGLGVNSSSDDYYPSVDNDSNEIYFTSNRSITKSGEDIYKANLPVRDIVISFDGKPNLVSNNEINSKVKIIESVENTSVLIEESEDEITFQKVRTTELSANSTISDASIAQVNQQIASIVLEKETIPEAIYIGEYQRRAQNDVAVIIPSHYYTPLETRKNIGINMIETTVMSHVPDNDIVDLVPPPAFKIPNFGNTNSMATSTAHAVNYSGARLVSIGEVIKQNISSVYFVQLAAFYSSGGEMSKFEKLAVLGNIYKVFAGTAVKVRLGYYNDHNDASEVLSRVKGMGYNDAFLVNSDLNTANMELIYSNHSLGKNSNRTTTTSENNDNSSEESSNNFSYTKPIEIGTAQQYKVRLASYEDPIWFESSKIKDLGQLEQWSKGSWTIFILSGYKSYEEAEMARIKAVNRGYADAEVVIDNQGIIERLKKN